MFSDFLPPPSADTVQLLLTEIDHTLRSFHDEQRTVLNHFDHTLRTACATLQNRKLTHHAYDMIKNQHTTIRHKLADMRHETGQIESYVNLISEIISELEPNW